MFDDFAASPSGEELARRLGLAAGAIEAIDGGFETRVRSGISDVLRETRARRDPNSPAWRSGLPCFLAGGGASDEIYRRCMARLDHDLRHLQGMGGLIVRNLPRPERFRIHGVGDEQFHRLAVAFGLAHDPLDLGEYLPSNRIPDVARSQNVHDYRDRYVGLEQM